MNAKTGGSNLTKLAMPNKNPVNFSTVLSNVWEYFTRKKPISKR
jgi:hypothetical protein